MLCRDAPPSSSHAPAPSLCMSNGVPRRPSVKPFPSTRLPLSNFPVPRDPRLLRDDTQITCTVSTYVQVHTQATSESRTRLEPPGATSKGSPFHGLLAPTRREADFSGRIRSQGYQSHGNHSWSGGFSQGIWGRKLSVNTTPFDLHCTVEAIGEFDLHFDFARGITDPEGIGMVPP